MEWHEFLAREEWERDTKQDYYLAQIAAEIRLIRESLSSNPKPVAITDLLLKRDRQLAPDQAPREEERTMRSPPAPAIIPSPEAIQDPKWARVNTNAQAVWMSRLHLSGELHA